MLQHTLLILAISFLHALTITADHAAQSPLHSAPPSPRRPKHIAIIGAGPGGASASYHLRAFSRSPSGAEEVPLSITLFEANPYIGGRSTTVNALDDPRYPVELGASIFVEINHILYNATRDLGLQTAKLRLEAPKEAKYELGIWDGRQFVFSAVSEDGGKRSWSGWWDLAKLFWRYGLAPIRTRSATRVAVGDFLKFYDRPIFPFASIQEAVDATGLAEYTGVSGTEVLQRAKVGELFAREIVQASTRVNYASNLGGIHGLETLVCMAIEGAMAVEGGNWQIFDRMAYLSADAVFLNARVTEVTRGESGQYRLKTTSEEVNQEIEAGASGFGFDAVILAAPYQFSNLTFLPPLRRPPTKIPYVELYVTLLTSPHRLSPSFFGLDSEADVPSSVLTTLTPEDSEKLGRRRGVDAVGPPGFWSISTLDILDPSTDGILCGPTETCTPAENEDTQYLYKIFSPAPLTATFLSSLLDFPYAPTQDEAGEAGDPLSSLPKAHVSWLVEKHWHSYPYETPRTQFENFTLCVSDGCEFGGGGDGDGLFYLNGMESFISTMETSALSGMNVARLIVDSFREAEGGE
jgi:prenylcysteine oxidase / farnesylcysteine lyase